MSKVISIVFVGLFCMTFLHAHELPVPKSIDQGSFEDGSRPLRVLVLYSYQRTLPSNKYFQQGLWETLQAGVNAGEIEVFEEFLEAYRLPVGGASHPMIGYLSNRYISQPPDVVVSVSPPAFTFMQQWSPKIFPDALHVFAALRQDQIDKLDSELPAAGVIYVLGVQSLFEVVAEQLPETREVLLVGGVADHDRDLIREARKQLEENFSWDISEMSGILPDEMAQKLSELSSDTVVLFTTYLSDSTGEYYIPRNVIGTLAEKSSVPIFALFDPMIDPGATGVGAVSFFDVGNRVGEVIERLYQGESPEEIGHITQSHLRLIFDDRKMRAYGLDSDTLPEDAVVLNSEKSIFETSPIATSFGIFMIVIQSCLIIALLWTRRRRLHAEGKTHEMKHYFSTVFMENPNPMAVVDMRDGVFRNINPAWEKLHGISRESAIGQTQFEVALVSGNSDATSRERFVVFKKNLSNYECCIRTGDGETHHVAFHSNSIDIAGESLQIVTMVDINDRVEAEKFRNSLMRDNRVTQLGQISAWIAHEINQPLGSILNNAEAALMQLDAQSISRDQLTEILADIKSDNRRASSVVERIRSMLGHHTISSEIVAVNTLIEEVSKMVKPEADRQNVYFKAISAMSSDAAVSVDHVLILQVFLNLISNAMEAVSGMPLSRRVVTLKCEILPDGKTIDFTLSDHGPGVPADKLDEIFNFFYTSKEIGLGLGLAISRSIVKESKGELFAENNPEGGACFHVRLPLLKQLL